MAATSPAHLSDLAFLNVTGRVARTLWIESTIKYLGVEVEDALEISEQTDV